LVSIVIPTEGEEVMIDGRRIALVVNCVRAIRENSTYKNLELITVDDGNSAAEAANNLRDMGCKLVSCRDPNSNAAKKLNLGASFASGENLLLLNDNIKPVTPDWIERLLDQLQKQHVGAVGAKLLYPDGTTQHVGLVLVEGHPDYVRRFHAGNETGYFFS